MTHPAPITLFDYMSALTSPRDIHPSRGCDAPITGGCERRHAPITPHDAYLARFGTLDRRTRIGTPPSGRLLSTQIGRRAWTAPMLSASSSMSVASYSASSH